MCRHESAGSARGGREHERKRSEGQSKGASAAHTQSHTCKHMQHTQTTAVSMNVPTASNTLCMLRAVAFERGRILVGTLVGSGRVESYVLDVASMHASALAFLHRASCEYTSLASRRSASRPHVRLHGPQRATTSRPTDMVAPFVVISRASSTSTRRHHQTRHRSAQGLSTGIGIRRLHVHAP